MGLKNRCTHCVVNRTRHLKRLRQVPISMNVSEWMNERVSEVLSMLLECLDLWVPHVFRQGELALSSIQRRVWLSVWTDAWVSDFSANTASVANTWVNGICCLVRTDFCSCVMANLSLGIRLQLKNDINFFPYTCTIEKDPCGGLYTWLFYMIVPTLFPYFLQFCYPYILLHF